MGGKGAEESDRKDWTIINGGGPVFLGCGSAECHLGYHLGHAYHGEEGGGVENQKASQMSDEWRSNGVTSKKEEPQKERPHWNFQAERTEGYRQLDMEDRRPFTQRQPNVTDAPGLVGRDLSYGASAVTSPVCKNSPQRQKGDPDYSKLFVGQLPSTVTDDILRSMFGPFGRLQGAKIITDHATGASKGYGFVKLSTSAEAQEAIRAMHGHKMGGSRLNVKLATPRGNERSSQSKPTAFHSPASRLPASPPVVRLKGHMGQSAFSASSPLGAARCSDIGVQDEPPVQGVPAAGASPPPWKSAPQARGADAPHYLRSSFSDIPPPVGQYEYRAYEQASEYTPLYAAPTPKGAPLAESQTYPRSPGYGVPHPERGFQAAGRVHHVSFLGKNSTMSAATQERNTDWRDNHARAGAGPRKNEMHFTASNQAGSRELHNPLLYQGLPSSLALLYSSEVPPSHWFADVTPESREVSSPPGRQASGTETVNLLLGLGIPTTAPSDTLQGVVLQSPQEKLHCSSPLPEQDWLHLGRQAGNPTHANEQAHFEVQAAARAQSARKSVLGKRAMCEETEEQQVAIKRTHYNGPSEKSSDEVDNGAWSSLRIPSKSLNFGVTTSTADPSHRVGRFDLNEPADATLEGAAKQMERLNGRTPEKPEEDKQVNI